MSAIPVERLRELFRAPESADPLEVGDLVADLLEKGGAPAHPPAPESTPSASAA